MSHCLLFTLNYMCSPNFKSSQCLLCPTSTTINKHLVLALHFYIDRVPMAFVCGIKYLVNRSVQKHQVEVHARGQDKVYALFKAHLSYGVWA